MKKRIYMVSGARPDGGGIVRMLIAADDREAAITVAEGVAQRVEIEIESGVFDREGKDTIIGQRDYALS